MRKLLINNIQIDIDERTAIGITFQSYDIKDPSKPLVNISNSFSIPATSKNLAIFGNIQNYQSNSKNIYNQNLFDYYLENEHIIQNAKIRCEEISEGRMNLFIYDKSDLWDDLKKIKFPDFMFSVIDFLQTEKGLYSIGNTSGQFGFANVFQDADLLGGANGIMLKTITLPQRTQDDLYYAVNVNNVSGANVGESTYVIRMREIFEYLKFEYGVNFGTEGGIFEGNIWDDPVASEIYIPLFNLGLYSANLQGADEDYFFYYDKTGTGVYSQGAIPIHCPDKTAHQLIIGFFQYFNIVKDEITVNAKKYTALRRFDDLKTLATVIDFSKNFVEISKFKPTIQNYAQKNYIKFAKIFSRKDELKEQPSEFLNSKLLTCNNLNIDVETDLFSIDAEITGIVGIAPDFFLEFTEQSFSNFHYLVDSGQTKDLVELRANNQNQILYYIQKSAMYLLDSEYTFLNEIIKYPRYYEIKKWFTSEEIRKFEFFKQYYFKQLGGSFFINKILNYNPLESKEPTTLELFKISDKIPIQTLTDIYYFVDESGNYFVDESGNLYY